MKNNTKTKKVKRFSSFLNNKMDYILFVTVLILLSLGVVMVLSASAPSALSRTGKSYTYFLKQFEFAILGIAIMLFISKIDYRFYKKYYWLVYAVSVFVLLLVLIPNLGKEVNGATRWISIPGLRTISTFRNYKNRNDNFLCWIFIRSQEGIKRFLERIC